MMEKGELYLARSELVAQNYQPFTARAAEHALERYIKEIQDEELEWSKRGMSDATVQERITRSIDVIDVSKPIPQVASLFSSFYTLNTAADRLLDLAQLALDRKDPDSFIVFFDTFDAAAAVSLQPIRYSPKLKSRSRQDIDTLTSRNTDLEEERKYEATAKTAKGLLVDNPSGFSLVDEMVKKVKGLPSRIPYYLSAEGHVPQFTAAGADFAQAIYNAIYPTSKRLSALLVRNQRQELH